MTLDTGKIRRQCHEWVDQVIGSSNAGVAHQVVDSVVDTVLHVMDAPHATPGNKPPFSADRIVREPETQPWKDPASTEERAKLYGADDHLRSTLDLLESRDHWQMRAHEAEEICGELKEKNGRQEDLIASLSARGREAEERADAAETRADELQELLDQANADHSSVAAERDELRRAIRHRDR